MVDPVYYGTSSDTSFRSLRIGYTEKLDNGVPVHIRLARSGDMRKEKDFLQDCSADTVAHRFFGPIGNHDTTLLIHPMTSDRNVELTLVAEVRPHRRYHLIGIAQMYLHPEKREAELAFIVSDRWQSLGVGGSLLRHVLRICRTLRIRTVYAFSQTDNGAMLHVFEKNRFRRIREGSVYRMELGI